MDDEYAEADGTMEDQGQALPELADPGDDVPEPWDDDEGER